MAGLADDIRSDADGHAHGDRRAGGTLSGGQRQRLLIARAHRQQAAHPALRRGHERARQPHAGDRQPRAWSELKATRIVIAHRLSTMIGADRIYVLERGQIVESGTFDELMALDGKFAAQARRQLT